MSLNTLVNLWTKTFRRRSPRATTMNINIVTRSSAATFVKVIYSKSVFSR